MPGWALDPPLIFVKCSWQALCIYKHVFSIECNIALASLKIVWINIIIIAKGFKDQKHFT